MAFTVRIERGREAHVVACKAYRKTERPDGVAVLTLYPSDGPVENQVPTMTLAVDEDRRVFVMNESGNTVDTLRSRGNRR